MDGSDPKASWDRSRTLEGLVDFLQKICNVSLFVRQELQFGSNCKEKFALLILTLITRHIFSWIAFFTWWKRYPGAKCTNRSADLANVSELRSPEALALFGKGVFSGDNPLR